MRKLTSILLLTGVVALGLTACDDDEPTQPAPSIDQISVTPQSVTLQVGSTAQLAAQVQTSGNANPTVSWQSADTDVATVDGEGVVTGVQEGNTTVTATATAGNSSKSAAAQVTVNPAPAEVRGVSISPSEFTVGVGETTTLSATVDAQSGVSTDVDWSTSDESVATVDGEGTVSGESEGNVTITATSVADPSKSASASGTVQQASTATVVISSLSDDADDVQGQLTVTAEFEEGSETITSADLMVDDTIVDSQTFSSTDIEEMITSADPFSAQFEFNSAAFDDSTGEAHFQNGEHDLKVQLTTSSSDTASDEHVAAKTVTFNNSTTFAFGGGLTFSSDTANDASGLRWIEGDASAEIMPVSYDEGESFERVTVEFNTSSGSSISGTAQTDSTADDGFTFNWYNAAVGDTVDGTEIESFNSIDNLEQQTFLDVSATVLTNGESGPTGGSSDTVRVDNAAPSLTAASLSWRNASDSVQTSVSSASDGGVGGQDTTYTLDGSDFTSATFDGASESDSVLFVVTVEDKLANSTKDTTTFGVDKTDPTIEFRAASVGDSAKLASNPASQFRVSTEDTLSGAGTVQTKLVRYGPSSLINHSDGTAGFISNTAQCRVGDYDGSDNTCSLDDGSKETQVDENDVVGSDGDDGYYVFYSMVEDNAGNSSATIERIVVADDNAPSGSLGTPSSATGLSDVTVPSSASDALDLDDGDYSLKYDENASAGTGTNSTNVTAFDPDGDNSVEPFTIRPAVKTFGSFGNSSFATSESNWVTFTDFVRGVSSVASGDASAAGNASVDAGSVTIESIADIAGNTATSLGGNDIGDGSDLTTATFTDGGALERFLMIQPGSDQTITAGSGTVSLVAEVQGGGSSDPFDGVKFYARVTDDTPNGTPQDGAVAGSTHWIEIAGFGDVVTVDQGSGTFQYEFSWTPSEAELERLNDIAGTSGDVEVLVVALGVDSNGDGLLSTSNENSPTGGANSTIEIEQP